MDILNDVLLIIFIAIFVFLAYQVIIMYKTVTMYAMPIKKWKIAIVVFLIIFDIFSFFIYVDILDLVRIIISTLVVFLFLLLRDGIGDEAIFGTATRIYYRDILAYDFKRSEKSFNVYFLYNDQKDASKGKGPYNLCIEFDLSKEKDVICTLQNKLPKKYKRLKKDNI